MSKSYTFSFLLIAFLCLGIQQQAWAQAIKGSVADAANGEPIIGATLVVEGTTVGTITDINGNFVLKATPPVTLIVSFVGYETQNVSVSSADAGAIQLEAGVMMDDVIIIGSRFAPRTVITSPVPIDNIKAEDLISTGQPTVDKMLHYSVPSFNSTQQTISDATAHFDPADLRGLGPSRTLVLINGKRKNPSSLVFINDTPGKGEVGVDMKSIPAAAIERVEVLRDGASAQYGSDAIAGVINVILKDDYEYTDLNLNSGITLEGDGFNIGYNLNTGFKIKDKGYVNLTTSFSDQKETQRAGEPGQDDLFGVGPDNPWIQANPDLGMTVGLPNMTTGDIMYNASFPIANTNVELYSFGGLTYRKGKSYALYRTPYWVPDPHNIFHAANEEYQGFQPSFETDILDNTFAVGAKGEKNDWAYDISHTTGSNSVDYTIGNTLNPALGAESPTNFFAGGYRFSNNITNLDIARNFDFLSLGFGTEFRTENFEAVAGEEASYIEGGAQSFPGLQPQNEVDKSRYNVGIYADLGADITDDFFLGFAARFENYSDFGETFNWKASARYKFLDDKFSVRASASTGFRAPSLHQIYLSNVQTLVSGGTISNQGTFNNESPIIRQLGVSSLKEEEAFNFTAGLALRPINGLYISLDYYQIKVDDRIVYSSSIASSDTTILIGQILNTANITSLKFFTNAVNTTTQGVDLVANYSTQLGAGKLGFNLGININNTSIDGQIATPAAIEDAGFEIFDRKEQSRILSARPQDKEMLGISYEVNGFKAVLNNTRFGDVTWQHGTDPANDQTFAGKVITDLHLSYRFNSKVGLSVAANNLLNVYPDEIVTNGDPVTDLGGRFRYPWEVNQFGFNGTTFSGTLNLRF